MIKRNLILVWLAVAIRSEAQPMRRGLAFDSLHGRPMAGAIVTLPGTGRSLVSDSAGIFSLDGVPNGKYRIVIQHDVLDVIGLNAVGTTLTVADSGTFVAAIPSFSTLWRLACAATPPARDSGLLFGTLSAGKGHSTAGAVVQAFWVDVSYDKKAGFAQKRWMITSSADSAGNFALCGVPTGTGLVLRASLDSSKTIDLDVPPLDNHRVFRRDMRLLDVKSLSMHAVLRAVVVDSAGGPIANADVSVYELGLSAKTGADGRAAITDVVPGSYLVSAKAIGYLQKEDRLNFADVSVRDAKFILTRVTTLDSVTIKAARPDAAMLEFSEHMKRGFGTFLTRQQLAKLEGHPLDLALNQAQGASFARGYAGQAWVMSKSAPPLKCPRVPPPRSAVDQVDPKVRACYRQNGYYLPDYGEIALGMKAGCYAAVYLDRVLQNPGGEPFDLNTIPIAQLEAIEWFTGRTQAPIEYSGPRTPCGIVLLHSRR